VIKGKQGTKHLSEGRDVKPKTLRFIIAQVQDDFYGNVGTYKVFELKLMSLVDNKNRVLLLTSVKTKVCTRKIGGSNPPLGTIQTKYECIWIILTNKI
tara:strand:+ start:253 stop:546 length:294 start_codon:yes stop_codon:yes gene_type:complete